MRKWHNGVQKNTGYWLAIAALLILAVISLFPLVLVLINSIKTHAQIMENPLAFPTEFHFENFDKYVGKRQLWRRVSEQHPRNWHINRCGRLCIFNHGICSGYAQSKNMEAAYVVFHDCDNCAAPNVYAAALLLFCEDESVGNPYAVGAAIAAWNLPMPIFLMRTYFLRVPYELEEAARLDGATTWEVFSKIVMPIASPGMITVACIVGLFSWNEYLLSTTLLQNEANFTATLKFLCLNGPYSRDFSVIMSGAVIMLVPIVVVFLLLQEQFVEGMAGGAVKG